MKKFVGSSIQEALHQALCEFECAPAELEYEVVLSPKKGFLGFGKQDAVILAQKKQGEQAFCQPNQEAQQKDCEFCAQETYREDEGQFVQDSYSQIQDAFFQEKIPSKDIGAKLTREISELFSFLPYDIDQVKVRLEKDGSVYVELNGPDCGLLIGEKGYRYNAIYYLLSIWIKKEYGLNLRLEIADFLKNKEKKIEEYLEENYNKIISRTFFQTHSFDLLGANIALKRFREAIPDKYIVIKQISENENVIIINEFRSR